MKSLQQYAGLWRKIGKRDFRQQYGKPALLAVGIVAEVDQKAGYRDTGTLAMSPPMFDRPQATSVVGRAWLITKGPEGPLGPMITAGRSAYNDIVVPEYTVSSRHCQFRYEPGRLLISDSESFNGTYVNEQRLLPGKYQKLRPQDRVVLGRYAFVYVSAQEFLASVEQLAA